jgi:predicted acyltransferase
MEANTHKPARIESVDALRGFDMLMIIFADRFFFSLKSAADTPVTRYLETQFMHPDWFGSHLYDMIMPLFLFIVGVVIPYSLSGKIQESNGKLVIYKSILRRFIILFFLGWIVQGNLLDLDPDKFQIMSNTLQAIAVGYLFSSIAFLQLTGRQRYILFASCLVIYTMLLTLPQIPGVGRSKLLPEGNFAWYVENLVFGKFADSSGEHYTWLLSGFGFTATVLSGLFAGELIRSNRERKKVAACLLFIGISGILLGLFFAIWHPMVKKIWNSTFVLYSSGICYILLALFYWIIDIKGYKKWAHPFKIIGMNAIVAYFASHVLNFPAVANSLLFGLEKYAGPYYEMITTVGGFGILYFILWYMFKHNSFVKI